MFLRTRTDAAIACDDQGALRFADQLYALIDVLLGEHAFAGHACEGNLIQDGCIHHFFLHVIGDAQHHGAGCRFGKQMFGRLVQHSGQVIRAFDQFVVARDTGKQCNLVNAAAFAGAFLQASLAENMGRGFAGDDQDRLFVRIGIGDPRHQIGGARTRSGNAGGDFPRGPGIAAGHEGRPLFMLDQYALDVRVVQAVIDRQDMGARHAEDNFDPQALQIPYD